MRNRWILSAVIALALSFPQSIFAYSSPGQPTGFVNDFANVIPDEEQAQMEQKLKTFSEEQTNEIAVVTIVSLEDETIESYALQLFEEWGIGSEKFDNGVLLLIAPNDRKLRIEVGYGLEGALTDYESKSIIENDITPSFKEGDYVGGINKGIDGILAATTGEYEPQAHSSSSKGPDMGTLVFIVIMLTSLLDGIFAAIRRAAESKSVWPGAVFGGGLGSLIGFFAGGTGILMLAGIGALVGLGIDYLISNNKSANKWAKKPRNKGNGGSWFGGSGGSSSGGSSFGGFSGGSSGGGGSSGSW